MSSTAVRRRSATVPIALTVAAIAFTGAIFGFFYAWVCSTMWGLDAADPTVAITAMNAMNSSVRNWVFAPVFFGTVVVLAAATVAAGTSRDRRATILLGAATVIYFGGAFLLNLFAAYIPGHVLATYGQPPLAVDIMIAFGVAAGFIVTAFGVNYLFAGKSFTLFAIDAGYWIVTYSLMGVIFGYLG